MYIHTEIHCKELVHVIVETDKSKSAMWAVVSRPRRADGADEVQRQFAGELLLVQGDQSFCLFSTSTDWMRFTHIMEEYLLTQGFTI